MLIGKDIFDILVLSLQVSVLVTSLVLIISFILVYILLKFENNFIKIFEIFIYIPMAIPPVALGYGLLIILGPNSLLGSYLEYFNINIIFSFWGAVIASFFASLGIGIRGIKTAIKFINPNYYYIAELSGGNNWEIFWGISWPLVRPQVGSTCLLVFIRSLGEFGATITLAGNIPGQTQTLALAIWTDMQTPGDNTRAIILIICSVSISVVVLFICELIQTKRST